MSNSWLENISDRSAGSNLSPLRRHLGSTRRRFRFRLKLRYLLLITAAITIGVISQGISARSATPGGLRFGLEWTQLHPKVSPPPRTFTSMAYDATTGDVVLFGGQNASGILGDTWLWNGSAWSEAHPSQSPSPRRNASMAYDPAIKSVVLFGGEDATGSDQNDTWAWSGATWTQLHPPTSPSARSSAQFALDPSTGGDLLFAGIADRVIDDTWLWNGSTWKQLHPRHSPQQFGSGTLADVPAAREDVLVGANDYQDPGFNSWTWTGSDWKPWRGSPTPPARGGSATSTLPNGTGVVSTGGCLESLSFRHPVSPSKIVEVCLTKQSWVWSSNGWEKCPWPRESPHLWP